MRAFWICIIILAGAGLAGAAGTAGSLDTDFDGDGLVVADFGYGEFAFGVVGQSDGKLVVVGNMRHMAAGEEVIDWGVARLDGDGSPDLGFGTGGSTSPIALDLPGNAIDVAIDADGNIIVVGNQQREITTTETRGKKTKTVTSVIQSIAIARLDSDGVLDTSFGSGGIVYTDVAGADFPTANSVVVLSSGDILVGGEGEFSQTSGKGKNRTTVRSQGAILLRYDSDGALDTAFGTGGIVVDDFSADNDAIAIRGVGVQSDGKVVIAGRRGFLRRYGADGALDTSFGSSGLVESGSDDSYLGGLAIDGSDGILACGYRVLSSGATDGLVVRYDADGTADWTHVTGKADDEELRGVVEDASGNIVAGGSIGTASVRDGYVIRLAADGTVDSGFSGALTTPSDADLDLGLGLALDASGGIVLVGMKAEANVTGSEDWLVARYNP